MYIYIYRTFFKINKISEPFDHEKYIIPRRKNDYNKRKWSMLINEDAIVIGTMTLYRN